jgi:hypothetical protein
MITRTTLAATVSACLCAGAAQAATIGDAIASGQPIVDLRMRYENVDDAGKPLIGQATTLRARLGYETASWNGLRLAFDVDQIWTIGGATYNSTRNGKTAYAVIADPTMTALDRLELSYDAPCRTSITIGRQPILIGNQRFVGDVGWRQHHQTFDSVSAVNKAVDGLALTYAYIYRVNRVFGPDEPVPSTTTAAAAAQANTFKSNSHVLDGVYTGLGGLRFEGYMFLLDLSAPSYATSAAQQSAVAKLSTATYGGRADYSTPALAGVAATLTGEYARQTGYGGNPLHYGLDYWRAEANLHWSSLSGGAGYEVMGGNGTIGFSTPLATLHAFDGWADLFLATPADGLTDAYFKAAHTIPADAIGMKNVTVTVVYHRFTTDRLKEGIGSEWDAQATLAVDAKSSFLVQYADYQGSNPAFGGSPDKSVLWLQAAYTL